MNLNVASDGAAYLRQIEEWRARRIAALSAEDGWLNLVGRWEITQPITAIGSRFLKRHCPSLWPGLRRRYRNYRRRISSIPPLRKRQRHVPYFGQAAPAAFHCRCGASRDHHNERPACPARPRPVLPQACIATDVRILSSRSAMAHRGAVEIARRTTGYNGRHDGGSVDGGCRHACRAVHSSRRYL